jgi:hypothetical protein
MAAGTPDGLVKMPDGLALMPDGWAKIPDGLTALQNLVEECLAALIVLEFCLRFFL